MRNLIALYTKAGSWSIVSCCFFSSSVRSPVAIQRVHRILKMALFQFSDGSASGIASALFLVYIVYSVGVAIHRLYFSQYAKFPGPKLAALTYGYMFYYDAIAGKGQYMYKIKDLHEEYSM